MRSKEEIMQALEDCIPRRYCYDCKSIASCVECPFGDIGSVTLTCTELLKDIYQYLKESDENETNS